MKSNKESKGIQQIPEFVKKIPTGIEFPMNLQVYEFIRDILLISGITVKDSDSTDQYIHLFITDGKKVLFEFINSYVDKRACVYSGKGDLIAAERCDGERLYALLENKESLKPNYMEILSDLIFWKSSVSRKHLYADVMWLKQQPEYKSAVNYVVKTLQTKEH